MKFYYALRILVSLYCLHYQAVFFIFNTLSRRTGGDYSGSLLSETLPQLLIMMICILFFLDNTRQLIRSLKK